MIKTKRNKSKFRKLGKMRKKKRSQKLLCKKKIHKASRSFKLLTARKIRQQNLKKNLRRGKNLFTTLKN